MKNAIRIALVDDHQIVVDGVKSLVKESRKFKIVASANNAKSILEELEKKEVDILVTDINMPEINGYDLALEVNKRFPEIKILALSVNGDGRFINKLVRDANIAGYILKNIDKHELIAALEKIAEGGHYFSDEVLEEMDKASKLRDEKKLADLTPRELEIIRLIEKEMSNKEIADALYISERTVETHRKNIFRKTNTNSVIGLLKFAYKHKLVPSAKK